MKPNRTRAQLTAEITALIIGKYPVAWDVKELSLATGAGRRTVERVAADLLNAGLIEKRYHSYTLNTKLVVQIYGAQWYVRQELDKDSLIGKKSHQLHAVNGGR